MRTKGSLLTSSSALLVFEMGIFGPVSTAPGQEFLTP